jgi:hypothetical protein
MRLDASGNLGLGVTPSAWGGYTALQVKDTIIGGVLGNNGLFGSNTYYSGSAFTYIASDTATLYRQLSGAHSWYTAASGTAGNAISFTQAMTLDASGNLGIGETSPAGYAKVTIKYDSGSVDGLSLTNTRSGGGSWRLGDGAGTVAGNFGFYSSTAASLRMVIDSSGNLGIGTSSPLSRLTVTQSADGYDQGLTLSRSGADRGTVFLNASNNTMNFGRSTSTFMSLDSSGNLGLGVTPSAWGSAAYKAFQIGQSAFMSRSGGSDCYILSNNYFDGTNFRYINSTLAGRYNQDAGTHVWYTAASGTAGNAIAWSQAMTLDASGNLGIGTTSPSSYGKFAVTGSISTISINDQGIALIFNRVGDNYINAANGNLNYGAGNHVWTNSAQTTEYARIDSSGNLLLGTTNVGAAGISINNAYNYSLTEGSNSSFVNLFRQTSSAATILANGYKRSATANGFASSYGSSWAKSAIALNSGVIQFFADTAATTAVGTDVTPTERARIISSGYSKFSNDGTYLNGSGTNHEMRQSATDVITYFTNKNGTNPYGIEIDYTALDPNGTGNSFFAAYGTTTLRAQIRSNGGLANYQANDVNLSDRREKTNFAPAKSYLDTICAIPVQTFNYVDQNLEEDPGLTLGVVAQDVQAVAPELVHESNWGTEDEPKMRLSIYQTDLQYALMKCIQEQQALITDLRARVAQLEAKG